MSLQCWQLGLLPAMKVVPIELPNRPWICLNEIVTLMVYGAPLDKKVFDLEARRADPKAGWGRVGKDDFFVEQLEVLVGEKQQRVPFDSSDSNRQMRFRSEVQNWLQEVGLSPDEALRNVRTALLKYTSGVNATAGITNQAYSLLDVLITNGEIQVFGKRPDFDKEIPVSYFAADRWHDVRGNGLCGGPMTEPESATQFMLSDFEFRRGSYRDVKVAQEDARRVLAEWLNWKESSGSSPKIVDPIPPTSVSLIHVSTNSDLPAMPSPKGRVGRAKQIQEAARIAFPPNGVAPDWMEPGAVRNKLTDVIINQLGGTEPDRKTYKRHGY